MVPNQREQVEEPPKEGIIRINRDAAISAKMIKKRNNSKELDRKYHQIKRSSGDKEGRSSNVRNFNH